MEKITLDIEKMKTPEAAHRYLRDALNFPKYYGENLDALNDCLGDIDKPLLVKIPKALKSKKYLGEYGERIIEVFLFAEEENLMLKIEVK